MNKDKMAAIGEAQWAYARALNRIRKDLDHPDDSVALDAIMRFFDLGPPPSLTEEG